MADEVERSGVHVVLHTARDAELVPGAGVEVCRCMDWLRDAGHGRPARVAARFLAVTVPHLLRGHGVLHVQGPFKASLLAALLAGARLRGRRVVFSPHNTFSRRGGALDARLVRLCARLAHATIVFSDADARTVAGWGATPFVSPLLQHLPPVDPARVAAWRVELGTRAGRALRGSDPPRQAARRGHRGQPAVDAARPAGDRRQGPRRRAALPRAGRSRGRRPGMGRGLLRAGRFAAAVAAADVVVCPYSRASQSGVLAVAGQLGVPTVASDVGGLRELATAVVPRDVDAAGLARSVDELLATPAARAAQDPVAATVEAHRRAYEVA